MSIRAETDISSAPGLVRRAAPVMSVLLKRAIALGAIFVLGQMLARVAIKFDPYFAVAGAVCLAFAVAVAYKPEFGILTYVSLAAFGFGKSPLLESQNSNYGAGLLPSQLILGLLLVLWMGRSFLHGRFDLPKCELNKPLIALGVIVMLSFLSAQIIYDTGVAMDHRLLITQLAEAGLFLLAIGAFFVTASSLRDPRWIKAMFYPIAIIGAYVIFFKLSDIPMVVPTPKAVLVVTMVGGFLLARLLFSQQSGVGRMVTVILFLGCATLAYASIGWVSGLVAFTLMSLTLIYLRSKKAFLTVMACGLLASIIWSGFLVDELYHHSNAEGDFDRIDIAIDSARMAYYTNPLLGIGPGNFYAYSFKYATIWYGPYQYTTAHNNYAQALAEMGLLGILAMLWVVYAGIRTGVKAFRETRADLKWVPAAATAVFIAFAVASLLGDYMFPNRANGGIFNFGIAVYVWVGMGAAVAAQRASASDDSDAPRVKQFHELVR